MSLSLHHKEPNRQCKK